VINTAEFGRNVMRSLAHPRNAAWYLMTKTTMTNALEEFSLVVWVKDKMRNKPSGWVWIKVVPMYGHMSNSGTEECIFFCANKNIIFHYHSQTKKNTWFAYFGGKGF
jgi:hypothetical protein